MDAKGRPPQGLGDALICQQQATARLNFSEPAGFARVDKLDIALPSTVLLHHPKCRLSHC